MFRFWVGKNDKKNYRRTRNKSKTDACGYVTEIQISFKAALSQKIGWTAINAKMDAFRQKIDTQGPPIGTLSRCPPIILQFGKEFCLFVWTIFLQVMCK